MNRIIDLLIIDFPCNCIIEEYSQKRLIDYGNSDEKLIALTQLNDYIILVFSTQKTIGLSLNNGEWQTSMIDNIGAQTEKEAISKTKEYRDKSLLKI